MNPSRDYAGGTARRRSTPAEHVLLYALAATLPFPLLGVPLNENYVLSLSSVLGLLVALYRMARHGLGSLHFTAFAMLLAFAATAVPRHAFTSYVASLGALALALAPMTALVSGARDIKALASGMLFGLRLTILIVLVSILIQLTGLEGAGGVFSTWLVRPEMGVFLGYTRPAGAFSEPSYLAIYLSCAYVVLDLLRRAKRYSGGLGPVVIATVVFTGSLSGVALLVVYLAARAVVASTSVASAGASARMALKVLGVGAALAAAVALSGVNVVDFFGDYAVRVAQTQVDIESLNLVGSEASRVNAVVALPDYWASAGLPGFLFGTGYANYQPWLLSEYGHLGDWATFSRGQIDNILVAVFLSTGLFGFSVYLVFLARAFSLRVIVSEMPLAIFVLAVNFSFGYLISGLYWTLLFVLASVARHSVACRGARVRVRRKAPPPAPQAGAVTAAP